ncbi:tail fiber domain-containing protein [Burkholderia anthina]|uniref:tail fiber domain-containing protein n=1 Tax=Burkholderia anthina TaxID=179879 RepID=UPI001AA06A42|nr:tail fiber domain-containing protein [Burkholderia anthina]QTD88883.1 tail fiber domain-containing protein [Burkholderia anthina]
MAIIGNLPSTLVNGTTADATQVMANFNYVLSQVNANAQPLLASAPAFTGLTLNEPANGTTTFTLNAPNDTNGANISMIGNGSTTPSKTVRVYNGSFAILNAAYSSSILTLDDSGNLIVTGDVKALSDETLKTEWRPLESTFVEKLAGLLSGTFSRTDIQARQVGVGAQSLQKILPEAVSENDKGKLSVAYGQAALAACVELAREVLRLRALLEPVK